MAWSIVPRQPIFTNPTSASRFGLALFVNRILESNQVLQPSIDCPNVQLGASLAGILSANQRILFLLAIGGTPLPRHNCHDDLATASCAAVAADPVPQRLTEPGSNCTTNRRACMSHNSDPRAPHINFV